MNPSLEAGLAVTLSKLMRWRQDLLEDQGYRLPDIPKRASKEEEMERQNVMAMAAVLGMDKQANALTNVLGRFARSGAGLPAAGGLVGAGLATPDALEALRSGDTTGAALRWGGGAAAGTGAGFLGRGLARTVKNLGTTTKALNTSRETVAKTRGELDAAEALARSNYGKYAQEARKTKEAEALARSHYGRYAQEARKTKEAEALARSHYGRYAQEAGQTKAMGKTLAEVQKKNDVINKAIRDLEDQIAAIRAGRIN